MTAKELHDTLGRGVPPTILDVRSAREFAAGHVPGAVNIPFARIGARVNELRADRAPLVVYCELGPRAWIAGWVLRRAGFTVDYLKGHMAAWRRARLPEER